MDRRTFLGAISAGASLTLAEVHIEAKHPRPRPKVTIAVGMDQEWAELRIDEPLVVQELRLDMSNPRDFSAVQNARKGSVVPLSAVLRIVNLEEVNHGDGRTGYKLVPLDEFVAKMEGRYGKTLKKFFMRCTRSVGKSLDILHRPLESVLHLDVDLHVDESALTPIAQLCRDGRAWPADKTTCLVQRSTEVSCGLLTSSSPIEDFSS